MSGWEVMMLAAALWGIGATGESVPKHSLALFTPEEIQRARQRLEREQPARQAVQGILEEARRWAKCSDEFLRETIPPAPGAPSL